MSIAPRIDRQETNMRKLLNGREKDGSRFFGALPETYDVESPQWHRLREHLRALPGAREAGFSTDDVTEAWLDFDYRGHRFTLNDQLGEWWFFVQDPTCPDDVLHEVLDGCESFLGSSKEFTSAPPQRRQPLFEFVGSDSLAQLAVWLFILLPAPVTVPALLHFGGAKAVLLFAAVGLLLLPGLRASIVVTPDETVITKMWFLVPYRRYRAPAIEDVWYGGDWGLEEGASGVVVELAENEIHIGSAKTMRTLHDALSPLSERHRCRVRARGT